MTLHLSTLPDRAILVRLTRSMYQPYAFDEKATELAGGAATGRFNKRLLRESSRLKDTNAAYNALYTYVKDRTVPWLDDGVRMLRAADYFEFAEGARALIEQAKLKSEDLAAHWAEEIATDEARFRQHAAITGKPDMFNADDYPRDVASLFNADIKFFPVPTGADFRVEITDEDKAAMEKAVADAQADVTKYVMGEILEPVKRLAEKLAVPIGSTDTEGKRMGIFRDSLVENLTDILERAPKLNINDDPTITETINEIKGAFGEYKMPDALRESPHVRGKVHSKLDELQKKLSSYGMGG